MIFKINNYTFIFNYSNRIFNKSDCIYYKQNNTLQKIDIEGFKEFIKYSLFLSKIDFNGNDFNENDFNENNINENIIFEYFKSATYSENNYFFGTLLNTLIYYYYFDYNIYTKLLKIYKSFVNELKYKKNNYNYFYFFINNFRYYIIKGDYIVSNQYLSNYDLIFDYNLS